MNIYISQIYEKYSLSYGQITDILSCYNIRHEKNDDKLILHGTFLPEYIDNIFLKHKIAR